MPTIFNKAELISANTKTSAQLTADEAKLNELQKFRTYSYHHILVVANTTEAAAEVVDNRTDLMGFMHPSMEPAKKYQAVPSPTGKGEYIAARLVLRRSLVDLQALLHHPCRNSVHVAWYGQHLDQK